jgi:CheY-like chemotaxis protein
MVEDEAKVRAIIVDALRELGLSVMEAEDTSAGLRGVSSPEPLDLLRGNIGLNGRALADAVGQSTPGLPVLLTRRMTRPFSA